MRPIGKPKTTLVLAGLVVFTMLGLALAAGLALLDDRIYRRDDLDLLTTVPVLAAIPRAARHRRFRFTRTKPTTPP
jgi:capsular polysaccharide biosynthesis protein